MEKAEKSVAFWAGNEACVEAALHAGCKFFAGYPITPASEISEMLSQKLPKLGGTAIQMEDELASIGAVVGASWAGAKSMTATSGPGFSLMQETIGYAFMTETPCVIVNVQRLGPSTGQATKCGQGDIMQTRWGTHGDYQAIALSPNSVQEVFELTVKAFNLSEKYRTPVVLLSDEITAHMRERVELSSYSNAEVLNRRKPKAGEKAFFGLEEIPPMPAVGDGYNVAVTGSTHNEYGIRYTADPDVHRRLVERLNGKILNHVDEIADAETHNVDDCKIGIVSFGCTSRAIYETVTEAEKQGVAVGFVRPRTIWPFPEKTVKRLAEAAEKIVVAEMNLKQVFYEVERVANGSAEVVSLNKIGGGQLITPEELTEKVLESARN